MSFAAAALACCFDSRHRQAEKWEFIFPVLSTLCLLATCAFSSNKYGFKHISILKLAIHLFKC